MLALRRFAQLRTPIVSRHQHVFSFGVRGFATLDDAIQLPMPALSPTMTHGSVVQWMLKEGDRIEPGSIMCEIETDKATVDYEAQDDGYLAKIIVQAGATDVPVGTVIGLVVEEEEMIESVRQLKWVAPEEAAQQQNHKSSEEAATPASTSASSSEVGDENVRASPAARHLLRLFAVPFSQVNGTGKAGMITKGDALKAVSGRELPASTLPPWTATPAPVVESTEAPATPTAIPTSGESAATALTPTSGASFEDVAATGIRKVIATRLTQSKTRVPHFYSSTFCNIDRVISMRKELKSQLGQAPSVNDVIIKAVALALRDVPAMNSRYEEGPNGLNGMIVANESIDVSVAVATPVGLITPIIFNADSKGLLGITSDMRDLAGRARIGKLKPEEYQGGSFSVSNLGMFGIDSFSAVINPPQAGILAIGAGLPVARIVAPSGGEINKETSQGDERKEDVVVFDTMMNVTLSCDRRVVDESDAARFMECFRTYMENPMYLSV